MTCPVRPNPNIGAPSSDKMFAALKYISSSPASPYRAFLAFTHTWLEFSSPTNWNCWNLVNSLNNILARLIHEGAWRVVADVA